MSKIIKNGQIFGSTDDKDIKSTDYDGNSSKLNSNITSLDNKYSYTKGTHNSNGCYK